ncbi:hypothetical protein, partial [Bradyrhizobium cosmicum]|uniref:hypothetical protein n=1 Tax=Bradyrhizobium cosmicum TaxID=1404864 RepID=UPI0028E95889
MIEISLIPLDLRHEELIVQNSRVLGDLQRASDVAVNTISGQFKNVKEKLDDIDHRVSVAKLKVKKLKETKNKSI